MKSAQFGAKTAKLGYAKFYKGQGIDMSGSFEALRFLFDRFLHLELPLRQGRKFYCTLHNQGCIRGFHWCLLPLFPLLLKSRKN